MRISIRQIEKNFGGSPVLQGVSCDIEAAELVTLLGPSGCGKTTLLRILAGLEQADSGSVLFDAIDATHWTVQERRVGFVFQHYALFPHLTVFENVAFGLRRRPRKSRLSEPALKRRVDELLQLVRLEQLSKRFPRQLSGGQQQRVAVARALAIEPRVLLLDEPFGALDTHVRQDLRDELRRLQQELAITCLMVTHDQEEALTLSDRIVLMNQGRIEQIGEPEQIYGQPESVFAMNYLGAVNSLPAHLLEDDRPGQIFVRAHDVEVSSGSQGGPLARVCRTIARGPFMQVDLDILDDNYSGPLRAEIPRDRWVDINVGPGQLVSWRIRAYKDFTRMPQREALAQSLEQKS